VEVVRAGRILVAAGVLDHDCLTGFADDLHAAIKARSRLLLNWDRRRGMLHRTMFAPPSRSPRVPRRRPVMVVMEVIVRHQDRGALRLDHRHNAAERAR
jgi:hypothetical protein